MKNNNKAFTLIELIITMFILTLIIPIVYAFMINSSNRIYLQDMKNKSLVNLTVVNNMISGLIMNSYGIRYSNLDLGTNLDTLILYTDKQELSYITLYIKQDLDYDLSRLYINKGGVEYPLHTSDLFIEEFNIDVSPKPVGTSIDIQPFVKVNIKGRTRSPLEEPTEDEYYDMYNKSDVALEGRWLIRNYVPSSGKY